MHPARANVRAVWLSLFTTAMGLMALLPVLALYVEEEFGIDDPQRVALWASLIYGAGPLSAACMGPIWGAMGDRYGKKAMALRANLAIAVTTSLMPLAETPLGLFLLRVAQGVLSGYVAPAMSLATSHLPKYVHGRIIARLQVAMALGTFVGPYVGAELTGLFGRKALFWFAGSASALAALRIWIAVVEPPPNLALRERSFVRGFFAACAVLLKNRVFAWLLVLLFVLRLGQNMLEPMIALFVRELGPARWIAWLSGDEGLALDRTIAVAFGVLAVGQWLFTPWWGRMADRHGPLRSLIALSLGLAVLFGAMALVTGVNQFLLVRCAMACVGAGSMTLAFASISKRVAAEHRTLAFSLVQSCIQLGLAFGPMLGAWVASGAGGTEFRRGFALAAVLCCLAGTGMVLLRRVEARAPA